MSRKTMGVLIVLLVGLLLSGLGDRGELSLAQGGGGPSPQAIVTPLLQYQGRLSHPLTGEPMDGVYAMSFRLYNAEVAGDLLWTETEDVPVEGGLFSNVLGDSTPLGLSLFKGQALWLGIKVGADPEAVPRQPVLPVAYALSLVPGAVVGGPMQVDGDLDVTGSLTGPHAGDADAHHVRYTDAEAWNTVLVNDGPFSGLNADLLDGLDSGSFALSSHLHDGGHIQSGTIAEKYIDPVIARDPEVAASYAPISHLHDGGAIQSGTIAEKYIDPVIARDSEVTGAIATHAANAAAHHTRYTDTEAWNAVLSRDGPGSGLNADLLDGLSSSSFALAASNKFVTINPFSVFLYAGSYFSTGYGPYAGVFLPNSGVPQFSLGFTIPPDYTPGTDMTLRFIWNTPSTSCGIVLPPNYTSFARAGSAHIQGPSATDGLYSVGGDTLSASATANRSSAKDYTIRSPVAGTNLQPGDSVIVGLYRSSAGASDTCTGDLVIQGIRIIYN